MHTWVAVLTAALLVLLPGITPAEESEAGEDAGQAPTATDEGGETTPAVVVEEVSAPGVHTVIPGDTLWDLCQRYLNNPWYWEKVWALNPHIQNPHWIYPGDKIHFKPHEAGETTEIAAGGEIELPEGERDFLTDEHGDVSEGGQYAIDRYTGFTSSAFNFFQFRRAGFLSGSEIKSAAVINNSSSEKYYLTEGDEFYASFADRDQAAIGQLYEVFRSSGEIEHPVSGDDFGYKIEILGQAVVVNLENDVVTCRITKSYNGILRGDKLRAWTDPEMKIGVVKNDRDVKGYIVDSLLELTNMAQNQLVYLDKGADDGVLPGNRFFILRSADGFGARNRFEGALPYEKIGEAIVLSVSSSASAALISKSLKAVNAGDVVQMVAGY